MLFKFHDTSVNYTNKLIFNIDFHQSEVYLTLMKGNIEMRRAYSRQEIALQIASNSTRHTTRFDKPTAYEVSLIASRLQIRIKKDAPFK